MFHCTHTQRHIDTYTLTCVCFIAHSPTNTHTSVSHSTALSAISLLAFNHALHSHSTTLSTRIQSLSPFSHLFILDKLLSLSCSLSLLLSLSLALSLSRSLSLSLERARSLSTYREKCLKSLRIFEIAPLLRCNHFINLYFFFYFVRGLKPYPPL
jgi:hypothetical protein